MNQATVENAMSLLNLESHYQIVDEVFTNHGLKSYFDNYFTSQFMTYENVIKDKDFIFKAKTLMLYYEGMLFHNLSGNEIKQVLLYGLYKFDDKTRKGQEPAAARLERIHSALPEKRQVSENVLLGAVDLMLRDIAKNKTDKATIIKDSASMTLYFNDDTSHQLVEFSIHKHMDGFPGYGSYRSRNGYDASVDYIHDKMMIPVWLSRWAKLKSFNRNYPKLIAASRQQFKEQNRVY